MTARIESTADLDVGTDLCEDWKSLAAARPAVLTELPLDEGPGVRIRFSIDFGALADTAEVIVPFSAVAQLVDEVRDSNKDGFTDALDGRPPRGRSDRYLEAYGLGQVEARARAS
jgi:hypothetical protein